jgi:multidrug resistance efflux pump
MSTFLTPLPSFPSFGGAGEVGLGGASFTKACEDYNYFIQADYHNQKINALQRQIALQQQLKQRTRKQCELSREQLSIQERLFASDSILYTKRAIALVEYESAKNTFLQVQQSYQSSLSSIDNIQLTITQYEQNIFDLQQQAEEKKQTLLSALSGAYEALQSQINQWELQYTFKSAIAGKISMTKQWQKSQHINAGEVFLSIVPEETAHITGKIMLPAQGSGKVKIGQAVNVKFDGYPHMEFGMVRGKVKSISLVPIATQQGKFTMVEIEFPENLTTNYGKTLDFSQEMSGAAEIITEDMRLIERFFNPIKSLMKR